MVRGAGTYGGTAGVGEVGRGHRIFLNPPFAYSTVRYTLSGVIDGHQDRDAACWGVGSPTAPGSSSGKARSSDPETPSIRVRRASLVEYIKAYGADYNITSTSQPRLNIHTHKSPCPTHLV